MSINPSQIKWGLYSPSNSVKYEGPMFIGSIKYSLPNNPDFTDKLIKIITSTEGGAYDSINMYDTCILSVGLIQFCEKISLVSGMLGECAKIDLNLVKSYLKNLPIPVDIIKNNNGNWHLCSLDGDPIDSPDKMRKIYLGGSNGNCYTDTQKQHSKSVAAVFASIWENESMRLGQIQYIKSKLMTFLMSNSQKILFSDSIQDGYIGAMKAAFLSYSVNLPYLSDKILVNTSHSQEWTSSDDLNKFTILMRNMISNSHIAIWPSRYKAIHPVLENLFSVSLPSLEEITENSHDLSDDSLNTTIGLQKALIKLGFDLGPKGPDGVFGQKTRNAILSFQQKNGLYPDGVVGPKTKESLFEKLQNH